jgi:lactoylglutathione lyase
VSGRAFPIFAVDDLLAARSFYERLGFVQTFQFPPAGAPSYVWMSRDGDDVGLSTPASETAHWVYVDDVDVAVAELVAGGAVVVAEPGDQPYGERVATVRAPGGWLVHLGMPS